MQARRRLFCRAKKWEAKSPHRFPFNVALQRLQWEDASLSKERPTCDAQRARSRCWFAAGSAVRMRATSRNSVFKTAFLFYYKSRIQGELAEFYESPGAAAAAAAAAATTTTAARSAPGSTSTCCVLGTNELKAVSLGQPERPIVGRSGLSGTLLRALSC